MTATQPAPSLADLYAADEVAWLDRMAALARAGRATALDLPNLIDLLESMGKSERRAVVSHLAFLIAHRLKWDRQPDKRTRSWLVTVVRERIWLHGEFAESRTLYNHAVDSLADAYAAAVRLAVAETGLPRDTFPADSPYTFAELISDTSLPGEDTLPD